MIEENRLAAIHFFPPKPTLGQQGVTEGKPMFGPFIKGFMVSGGLIVAIGAQNAFVLSQSVRRNHHHVIALICGLCDVVLIFAGILGAGAAVAADPRLGKLLALGGAAFLFWYGARALISARRGGTMEAHGADLILGRAVFTTLALTWLNPHAYIDTLVLIGGIGGQLSGQSRLLFGVGAVAASFTWFFSLSFFGGLLAPVFRKPMAWRVLDTAVCMIMWTVAASLLF